MRRDEHRQINAIHDEGKMRTSLIGRSLGWLFSQRHFYLKLLSGTALGIIVIVFVAGVSLYVTLQDRKQEAQRAHTIEVMRLASVIEIDIAGLETDYRGFLLTGKQPYRESFNRQRYVVNDRADDLLSLVLDNSSQRKRIKKIQEIVQKWSDTIVLPEIDAAKKNRNTNTTRNSTEPDLLLGTPMLVQAREILQAFQNDEQISLNKQARDQESTTQSMQILDLMPKLERSVVDIEREKRGFLLTGQESFVEAYNHSLANFNTFYGYLSLLLSTSPDEAAALSGIQAKVERWINSSAVPEIAAKRTGKDNSPVLTNESETLMGDIRQGIANFEKAELDRYETRTTAVKQDRILKTSALTLGLFHRGAAAPDLVLLQFCPLPAAVNETRKRRYTHSFHHRQHPRWHDHGKQTWRDPFDESGRSKNVWLCQ